MAPRSPLDYDVSVAADKRRRQRTRGLSGAVETSQQECQWPGCNVAAEYRAPHSPDRLNEFRWFCLAHVRQYNSGWNFFSEWSEQDLDAQSRADRVWERPTWSLGKGPKAPLGAQPHAEGKAWARWGFRDPHEVLGDAATLNPGEAATAPAAGCPARNNGRWMPWACRIRSRPVPRYAPATASWSRTCTLT
jgi:hypothetical protein